MGYLYTNHALANYYIFITAICGTPTRYIAYQLPLPPLCTTEPSNHTPTHSEKHYPRTPIVSKVAIGTDIDAAEERDRNLINILGPFCTTYFYSF